MGKTLKSITRDLMVGSIPYTTLVRDSNANPKYTGYEPEVNIILDCRCEQTSKSWSPSKRSFLIQ